MSFQLDNIDNYFGVVDGMGFKGLKTLSTKVEVQQRRKSVLDDGIVVTDIKSRKIQPITIGGNGVYPGVPVVSD